MRILLRKIKRILDKTLGTKMSEVYWKFRDLKDNKWPEKYISEESLNHFHRKLIIDKIKNYKFIIQRQS